MKKIRKRRISASRPMTGCRYVKADENYEYVDTTDLEDAIDSFVSMKREGFDALEFYITKFDEASEEVTPSKWFNGPKDAERFSELCAEVYEHIYKATKALLKAASYTNIDI